MSSAMDFVEFCWFFVFLNSAKFFRILQGFFSWALQRFLNSELFNVNICFERFSLRFAMFLLAMQSSVWIQFVSEVCLSSLRFFELCMISDLQGSVLISANFFEFFKVFSKFCKIFFTSASWVQAVVCKAISEVTKV